MINHDYVSPLYGAHSYLHLFPSACALGSVDFARYAGWGIVSPPVSPFCVERLIPESCNKNEMSGRIGIQPEP
ncbi:MAG TPA: hypothetical protein VI685_13545, partial [Candidatus Angelobacter sp.]